MKRFILTGAPGAGKTSILGRCDRCAHQVLGLNPKELLDPTALQNDLTQYGIPAKVTYSNQPQAAPARSCPGGAGRAPRAFFRDTRETRQTQGPG
jgi:hypothetical protein